MGQKQWNIWDSSGKVSSTGGTQSNSSYGSKSGNFHHGGCGHKGQVKVWEGQGIALYAAGTAIDVDDSVKAVIDLAGSARKQIEDFESPGKPPLVQAAAGFMASRTDNKARTALLGILQAVQDSLPDIPAKRAGVKPLYFDLDWPDMQAPKVGYHFWKVLWSQLPHAKEGEPASKVQVCCMGGHGRTGTCLAALLICNAGYSWGNAINYVRYHHCTSAVESESQITYLQALSAVAGTNTQPLDVQLADALDGVQGEQDAAKETKKGNGKKGKQQEPKALPPAGQLKTANDGLKAWEHATTLMKTIDISQLKTPSKVLIQPKVAANTTEKEVRLAWVPFNDYQAGTFGNEPLPDVYGVTYE